MLDKIPDLVRLLEIASRTVCNATGIGAGGNRQLSFDADMIQFLTALRTLLVACARDLTETRHIPFMPTQFAYDFRFIGPLRDSEQRMPRDYIPTSADIATWLKANIAHLRQLDSAPETFAQLRRALDRGTSLASGATTPIFRGPCPAVTGTDQRGKPRRCATSLYAPRGEAFVTCGKCKTAHDTTQLEQRYLADLSQALFKFGRLQQVLADMGEGVTDRTLSAWIKSGRLKPAAWEMADGTVTSYWIHPKDKPLYRLVDARQVRANSRVVKGSTA